MKVAVAFLITVIVVMILIVFPMFGAYKYEQGLERVKGVLQEARSGNAYKAVVVFTQEGIVKEGEVKYYSIPFEVNNREKIIPGKLYFLDGKKLRAVE